MDFEKSFASHPKSKFLSKGQTDSKFISRGTDKKYYFDCGACKHQFYTSISQITKKKNPSWCPYCANQKLCLDEKCKLCFEKSFASHPKSKYWSEDNVLSSRQIFKNTHKIFEFICEKCNHYFEAPIASVTKIKKPAWCPYCATKKLCFDIDCEMCFNNSFASHPKSKWWSERNDLVARSVMKKSGKIAEFKCEYCNHYFDSYVSALSKINKCGYCSNLPKHLCSDSECKLCFNNSFASHPKSKYWSERNEHSPREIFKGTQDKYEFKCGVCDHYFSISINSITGIHSSWCTFCSNPPKQLCLDEKCKTCFEKSFASHPKSKYWSERNERLPRELFKKAADKYEFKCGDCNNYFSTRLNDISRNKGATWCPFCTRKSEKKIYGWLKELYPDLICQYRPEWCESPESDRCYMYDFFIPSLNIILEIDGEQHFIQVLNWEAPKRVQSKDLYKMKLAYDRNISIIRVPYQYIYEEYLFKKYKQLILNELYKRDKPEIVYLCENEAKYNHFKEFDFDADIIPEIVPK